MATRTRALKALEKPEKSSIALESGLKRGVLKFLSHSYPAAVVRKRHGSVYSVAGDPDVYFLLAGIHVECELKQVGEEPTPLQRSRLQAWALAGAQTVVIHTVAEMRVWMERTFHYPGSPGEPPA
jgi:hypothetical protein